MVPVEGMARGSTDPLGLRLVPWAPAIYHRVGDAGKGFFALDGAREGL